MKKNKKNQHKFIEIFGWYGVIAILLAYILISFQIFTSQSLIYQLLNVTGSLGILIDAYKQKNYQPVVLNIVWLLIAVFAIISILLP